MSTGKASERLLLDYRLDAGVAVVTVTGEVDVGTCGQLREGLLRVVTDEQSRSLVVNLASVSFIDSTGLGVLVGIWRRYRASPASMALAVPSLQVRRTLVITGLIKTFSVYDTETAAVQACRQRPSGPWPGGPGSPATRTIPQ